MSTNTKKLTGKVAVVGQPQDIAPAVVFFASDDASWITGESLYITGGLR